MIPLPGHIYFDENFIFQDGEAGRKLFIVLCDSPNDKDNVLVARATSKQKSDDLYGCHFPSKWEAVFFIPANKSVFPKDTWIRFDYLVEYSQDILARWNRIGELSLQQTKDMLLCGSNSYTISLGQSQALKDCGDMLKT